MKMFKDGVGRFLFDDRIEIAYCPICDKSLFLRPYVIVEGKNRIGSLLCVRHSTHCDVCGHRIEVCIPYDPMALPASTEIVSVDDIGMFARGIYMRDE